MTPFFTSHPEQEGRTLYTQSSSELIHTASTIRFFCLSFFVSDATRIKKSSYPFPKGKEKQLFRSPRHFFRCHKCPVCNGAAAEQLGYVQVMEKRNRTVLLIIDEIFLIRKSAQSNESEPGRLVRMQSVYKDIGDASRMLAWHCHWPAVL